MVPVPSTLAAGALFLPVPSHSGCPVRSTVGNFDPAFFVVCTLWVPVICPSTCALRLPLVGFWLLFPALCVPAFCAVLRTLVPALRFTQASVLLAACLVPLPVRSASIFSALQPVLPLLRAGAVVLFGAALWPVPAVLFCPLFCLRSFSMSCALHPILSPHHFVPRHS